MLRSSFIRPDCVDEARINRLAARETKQVSGFVIAQLITSVVLAGLLLFYDLTAAYSGLIGGLIAALANGWFALKVFTARGKQPAQMLRSFYSAEINKLILTGSLFVAVFVLLKPVNAAALLAAYFLVHMLPALLAVVASVRNRDSYNNE
jgi:ATP synthase protein I